MSSLGAGQPPIYALKAEFFRTLGHPVRIRLLQLLRDGERTVGALQAALALDSSGVSQQLAALRKQGLVESRRDGTNVYYRVKEEGAARGHRPIMAAPRTCLASGSPRPVLRRCSQVASLAAEIDHGPGGASPGSRPSGQATRKGVSWTTWTRSSASS